MYNPGVGRFIQRDPLIQAGPSIGGAGTDGPNIYQYVAGLATISLDPTGLKRLIFAFEGLGGHKDELFSNISPSPMETWKKLLPSTTDIVEYLSQEQNSQILQKVKKYIDKPEKNANGQCVYPGIAILGYSQGGRAAIQAAESLDGANIAVDLGFTVDPVPKGLELAPPVILFPGIFLNAPSNAKVWINFYQTVDTGTLAGFLPMRGHPVGGAANTNVNMELKGFESYAHVRIMNTMLSPYKSAETALKAVPEEKLDWKARP
jgi:hypothetical protein